MKPTTLRTAPTPFTTLVLLALAGCGSSGSDPDPTPSPTGCTSDAQCGAGQYCDIPGSSSAPLLDPPCFFACLEEEGCTGDPSCDFGCAEACGATCPEFCDFACATSEGLPPEPGCVAECVPACEADRTPAPPPADAGTSASPQDAGAPPPSPPPAQGTCRARPTPPPPSDGGTPSPSDAGTTPAPLAWAGTWNVRAVFTARCMWSSAGAPRDAALDYTVTARLSGSNDDLTAAFGPDYEMTGTGSDSGLTLSGQFPGRDHNGNSATIVRRDNQVSIRLREVVGPNEARGTIEGRYDTSGGISCVIQDGGTVTFER